MPDMSKHARGDDSRGGMAAAWIVMCAMGLVSVALQVYHAASGGRLIWPLAGIAGLAPVAASMALTHMAATRKLTKWHYAGIFAVIAGAMYISIGSIAAVLHPVEGKNSYVYGLVLDGAALMALAIILYGRQQAAERAERAERENTAAAVAEATRLRGTVTGLEAELEQLRTDLATAQSALAEASSGRKPRTSSARNPKATSARKPARSSGWGGDSDPVSADMLDQVTTEAEAVQILAAEPGISGSELGRRLGKTDRYGRELMKRLTAAAAGDDRQ